MATGCASGPAYAPDTYVVQPRDTLYSIAWRHDLDYRELARWNHLGTDYRIDVGQVLTLKPGSYSSPSAASALPGSTAAKPGSAPAPGTAARPASAPRQGVSETAPIEPARLGQLCGSAEQHWTWPTAHASAPRPVPGGGILLLGTLGQPIRAACAGRVVYAGNGIRGYGNLIIIKHGDTVLSAYAHTVALTVHEGQEVALGEEIARMGSGAHDIAALYFEIRLNGKPVDPLPFLPVGE
jgi:lipoprotein NlpD